MKTAFALWGQIWSTDLSLNSAFVLPMNEIMRAQGLVLRYADYLFTNIVALRRPFSSVLRWQLVEISEHLQLAELAALFAVSPSAVLCRHRAGSPQAGFFVVI